MDNLPLKKNQDITLEITALTNEGSGLGRYENMAVFVSDTAVGDVVECHIIKVKKNYAVGKVINILKASDDRIIPDCPVYSKCGGCVYRHIDYEAEKRIKRQTVIDDFSRIGHMDVPVNEIIGGDSRERYRNKAQYPVRYEDGEIKIGFYARFSHRVIPCRDCLLQPAEFADIVSVCEKWIKKYGITAYNEEKNYGLVRHIYIRKAFATQQIMVCMIINGRKLPFADELADMLTDRVKTVKCVCVNYNTEKTNVILSDKCETVYGDGYIEDVLCGVRVRLSALSFYQVNRAQAQRLYMKAAEYAQIDETMTVLDLYCGTGTIGLAVAQKAKQLIGVEIIPEAIEDAKVNAALNGRANTRFICADAGEAAKILGEEGITPDVVIVDPPRKGCSRDLLETVNTMNPKRIVYISCDPATLARDCEILAALGWKTEEATPVDLFPATAHCESVARLIRSEINS